MNYDYIQQELGMVVKQQYFVNILKILKEIKILVSDCTAKFNLLWLLNFFPINVI